MNAVTVIGRFLFAIPLIIFGILYLVSGNVEISMVPPSNIVWLYIKGLVMLLAGVAVLIEKKDAVATFLLGLVLFASAMIQIPEAMETFGPDIVASGLLMELALSGAAFVYARSAAKDRTTRLM